MKKLVFLLCAFAVMPAWSVGRSMVGNPVTASSRAVVMPLNQFQASIKTGGVINNNTDSKVAVVDDDAKPATVNRDKERIACLNNNIGMGNTFVWAAKNSNTFNYSSMVEDTDNPENNVCFVLVGMRSEDSRISTADIQPRYFEWGQDIICGSWVDEAKMEARILDAKKTARTLGTIGGSVGGAGVGVGTMELFGNDLIGGAVQGQESLSGVQLIASQAAVLQQENSQAYDDFVTLVRELKGFCSDNTSDENCRKDKYKNLITWYDTQFSK